MISCIICSRRPDVSAELKENIASTIGCEYELVLIDNSKNEYSIFSAYNEGVRRAKGDILCFMHEDILLLLSTSVSETFGLAVAESILYGTKVVCTDSGGVRDFVNERNGIVVSVKDATSIVNAISNLMNDTLLPITESKKISEKYGYQNYKDLLLNSYNII